MIDELLAVVDEVRDIPAIVEGKRDRHSLSKLGFSTIHEIDRALYVVVERFDKGDVVQILTDLDKEGKRLYGRLAKDLRARGVRIDNRLRDALFDTHLSHIEGLARYIDRAQ